MVKFMKAFATLLKRGETILIYPEQGMWWNYRKPRPMQEGAFNLAVRNNTPVVPIFIGMEDSDVLDGDGFFVQEYTFLILTGELLHAFSLLLRLFPPLET